MDKVIEILGNKWTKFGFSLMSVVYLFFNIWVAWLAFAYYLSPINEAALMILYMFINFIFGVCMIYTRYQFITKIITCILPISVFVILILGFGNWLMIIPPLVICVICFFTSRVPEGLKVVIGTLFLIMFVVGTLAYITLGKFGINIKEIDLSERSKNYLYSTNNTYRLVEYISSQNKERITVSYYVEETKDDLHPWFLECYNVVDSNRVLVTVYENAVKPVWTSDKELYIDGRTITFPIEEKKKVNNIQNFDENNGETIIITLPKENEG